MVNRIHGQPKKKEWIYEMFPYTNHCKVVALVAGNKKVTGKNRTNSNKGKEIVHS